MVCVPIFYDSLTFACLREAASAKAEILKFDILIILFLNGTSSR
jgi:hypothetical protein